MKHYLYMFLITPLYAYGLIFSACGSDHNSLVKNVTESDNSFVSENENFWLYEGKGLGFNSAVAGVNFAPEAYPVSSQDFFWMKDGETRIEQVADPLLGSQARHKEKTITRIIFPPQQTTGSFVEASFLHNVFDGLGSASTTVGNFKPVFEARGPQGQGFTARLDSELVCFRIIPTDANPMRILNEKTISKSASFMLKQEGVTEFFEVSLPFTKDDVGSFITDCIAQNGELASQLKLGLKPLSSNTSGISIDFPGIFVSRKLEEVPAKNLSMAISPNQPTRRSLEVIFLSRDERAMICDLVIKSRYQQESSPAVVGELLVQTTVTLPGRQRPDDKTKVYVGEEDLRDLGVPGVQYVSGALSYAKCFTYFPR